MLGLLFKPKDGDSTFLRNVGELVWNYMTSHLRRSALCRNDVWRRHIEEVPRSRGLLKKLTFSQLVKQFTVVYRTRWFVAVFRCARTPAGGKASPVRIPHPEFLRK
jgi:hypothetical protein